MIINSPNLFLSSPVPPLFLPSSPLCMLARKIYLLILNGEINNTNSINANNNNKNNNNNNNYNNNNKLIENKRKGKVKEKERKNE